MTTNHNQPFHIIGFGAIGILLAAYTRLSSPACPVQVLLRDRHRSKIRDGHVRVTIHTPVAGTTKDVSIPATIISSLEEPIRNLVVTTKAFDAVGAVRSVCDKLLSEANVLVLCNGGLAVREELIEELGFPRDRVLTGSVTHGAYRVDSGDRSGEAYKIVHAGAGRIFVPAGFSHYSDVWSSLHCEVLSAEDMELVLWKKLAANAVCNPLTALHGVKNGELYQVDGFEQMLAMVVTEVVEVHNAIRPDSPLDFDTIKSFVLQVIDDNLGNRSSMYQDVANQRKTEIEYLNGFVVDAGNARGITCPENQRLVSEILSLEREYSA